MAPPTMTYMIMGTLHDWMNEQCHGHDNDIELMGRMGYFLPAW